MARGWLNQRRGFSALDTAPLSRLSASKSPKQWQRCVYCITEPGASRRTLANADILPTFERRSRRTSSMS